MFVGKRDLASVLGWSRPRLDRRIRRDRDFPIAKVGSQSGGWEFDLSEVRKHLESDFAAAQARALAEMTASSSPKAAKLPESPLRISSPKMVPGGPQKSFVYFIQNNVTGQIKIGVSKNVRSRLKSLQTASDAELQIVGMLPGGWHLERDLHFRFRHERRRGEWFEASQALLDYILSLNLGGIAEDGGMPVSFGMLAGLLSCCA